MIQILTGKIGAGKTLHAVEFIYDALCEGRYVATNIELNFDKLQLLALKERGVLLEEAQYIHLDLNDNPNWHDDIPWGTIKATVLVVLDEVHLFFNSRDYAKTDQNHRGMLSFLSQSRKAAVDVIFVAQVASQVEKQFRNQAKNEIYISDFGDFYLPVLGKVPLRQNILTTRDLDTGQVLRKQKRDYPKKMFGCYETLAFLDELMQSQSEMDKRLEPLKLRRPKANEKKELLIKLSGQDEILDNTNNISPWRRLWDLLRISRNKKESGQTEARDGSGKPTDTPDGTETREKESLDLV